MAKNNLSKFPETKKVFKKMCEMVGADYKKINFKKEGWWNKYEWTVEQAAEFSRWLYEELRKRPELRHEMMETPTANPQLLIRFVNKFVAFYGWKTKENSNFAE